MEIANKEELLSIIDDLQSRLAIVEDSLTKEPTNEPAEEQTDEPAEVESEDEIEKLLNS